MKAIVKRLLALHNKVLHFIYLAESYRGYRIHRIGTSTARISLRAAGGRAALRGQSWRAEEGHHHSQHEAAHDAGPLVGRELSVPHAEDHEGSEEVAHRQAAAELLRRAYRTSSYR